MRVADGANLVHPGGRAVEVDEHHDLGLRVQAEGLLQGLGVHVPRVTLGVHVDGCATLVDHGVHRSIEGDVAAYNLAAEEAASLTFTDASRGSIDLARCKLDGKMKSCCS